MPWSLLQQLLNQICREWIKKDGYNKKGIYLHQTVIIFKETVKHPINIFNPMQYLFGFLIILQTILLFIDYEEHLLTLRKKMCTIVISISCISSAEIQHC